MEYYKTLYTLDNPSRADIQIYLRQHHLVKQLVDTHKTLMDEPITDQEIQNAISHLKTSKTPSRDGIPAEFYKKKINIF